MPEIFPALLHALPSGGYLLGLPPGELLGSRRLIHGHVLEAFTDSGPDVEVAKDVGGELEELEEKGEEKGGRRKEEGGSRNERMRE
jgi:hypothetical protein